MRKNKKKSKKVNKKNIREEKNKKQIFKGLRNKNP
jgi:hypothetical protein